MCLSASTDPLYNGIDQNQVDKNLLSPPLSFSKQEKTTIPEQISNTKENAKNYAKKNGLLKFKIKSENRSIAYLRRQPMEYGSFSQENMLRFNDPLYYRNLSRVSNFLDTKKLEFETLNYQGFTPFLAPQFIPIPKNPYFGNYFPERNLISDKIFLSGLFIQNLKKFNSIINQITIDGYEYILHSNSELKTIYIGNGENLTLKMQNLQSILIHEKGNEGSIYLNMDFLKKYPYFSPKI